jgi:hypothetical protein
VLAFSLGEIRGAFTAPVKGLCVAGFSRICWKVSWFVSCAPYTHLARQTFTSLTTETTMPPQTKYREACRNNVILPRHRQSD